MPTPFAPWSNSLFVLLVVLGLLTVVGLVAAPMVYVRTDYGNHQGDVIAQPVEFDHRHHVGDDRIPCAYCHAGADHEARAGLPPTSLCMGCHNQVWNDSPELAPVLASYFNDQPIRWRRVYDVPDFVYFHHGVHVQADIQCERCHGPVEEMARVYRAVQLTMGFCLDCHEERSASEETTTITSLTTCTACHR